jgi:hypothetical protein
MLGIARYAPGFVPLASWVGSMRAHQMPDSVHAQVTGRTCIVFLRPVLERTGGNVLKCEFKDLSSKPYGVVENSNPSADQLENNLVLFFVSTVRWRDNEFSEVAS